MCPAHPPPATPAASPRTRRRIWLGLAAAAAAAGLPLAWWLRQGTWPWPGAGAGAQRAAANVDEELDFCVASPALAHDPASGLAPEAPRPVPADTRCPVCGMYPARYPRWAAQVIYRDHHAHFFDSPVDLLQFLGEVGRHRSGFGRQDILSIWVTDARSERPEWLPAERAWFVHGSSVRGPMRTPDLPAFASREQAKDFARERGGQPLGLGDINPDILRSLSSRRKHELHQHLQAEMG